MVTDFVVMLKKNNIYLATCAYVLLFMQMNLTSYLTWSIKIY